MRLDVDISLLGICWDLPALAVERFTENIYILPCYRLLLFVCPFSSILYKENI